MASDDLELKQARREAEQSLLGAILIDGACEGNVIQSVRVIVKVDDFLYSVEGLHGRIYEAMLRVKGPLNQITVAQQLNADGKLQKLDCAWLHWLVARCECSLEWPSYANTVHKYGVSAQIDYYNKKGNTAKVHEISNNSIQSIEL